MIKSPIAPTDVGAEGFHPQYLGPAYKREAHPRLRRFSPSRSNPWDALGTK